MLPVVSSDWGGLFKPSFGFAVNKSLFRFTCDMHGFKGGRRGISRKNDVIIIVISGRGPR